MKTLLENIKKIRESKGYSQEYMAKKLGIATVNYGKIERGITHMTIEKLRSISDILEKNITYMLENSINSSEESTGSMKLLERQKQDENIIRDLMLENDDLKNKNDEKSLLIKMLNKERAHIKEGFTSHFNTTCYWGVKEMDELINETDDEGKKESLRQLRGFIILSYKNSKEYCIKSGLLDKFDFEKDYALETRRYKDMPEHEILG